MKKKNPRVKIKTRKSVAKRFKLTASGKVLRRGAQKRHLNAHKTKSSLRRSKVSKKVTGKIKKNLKRMLVK